MCVVSKIAVLPQHWIGSRPVILAGSSTMASLVVWSMKVLWKGKRSVEARVGAWGGVSDGRQDVPESRGDADVGEERVESLAGEDLDAVAHVKDLLPRARWAG